MSTIIVPTYATQIAVMAAAAEKRVLERLRAASATRPEQARPVDPRDSMERSALGRLSAAGVLVEAAPGRFWLDERAAADRERHTARVAGTVVAGMAAVGLLLILFLELVVR